MLVADWPEAALCSLELGVVAEEPGAPVVLCSVELGVVALEPAADWPLMLELLELVLAGGSELGVVCAPVVLAELAVLWSLGGVAPEVVELFGGTEAVPPALASVVLRGGGTALGLGLVFVWSVLLVALPAPTVLEGVWLLTGGVVLDGVCVLALPCSVLGVDVVVPGWPMLVEEPVPCAEGLLDAADVPPAVAAPELPAAC